MQRSDTVIQNSQVIDNKMVIKDSKRIPRSLQVPSHDKWRAFLLLKHQFDTELIQILGEEKTLELSKLLDTLKPKYPYKCCKLQDYEGNLKKRWYIDFSVWNKKTAELEDRRQWISMKLKTLWERRQWAEEFMAEIDANLQAGKTRNPTTEVSRVVHKVPSLSDLLDEAFAIKKKEIKNEKTITSYSLYVRLIKEWLVDANQPGLLISEFDKTTVFSLFDWIENDFFDRNIFKIGNRTFNNYKTFIHSLFAEMVTRGHIEKNPIDVIKKRTVEESANFPFNNSQKETILSYLLSKEKFLDYYFCQFIYYTLSRPTEIIKLQRKHLFEDRILFTGGNSKNKKTKSIPMTDPCKELLSKMGVWDKHPDSYIFGLKGICTGEPSGENQFGQRHTDTLRQLDMWNGDYTMYTWKDTGACDLYIATKDIMYVKEMCRHSSVAQTEIYLRSMGMLVHHRESASAPRLTV